MYFFITGIFFKTIVTAVPKKHADKIHIIHEGRVCKYGNRLVNIDDVTFLYICSNKYIPNVHDPAIVRIFPGFPDNLWLANHIFAAKYTIQYLNTALKNKLLSYKYTAYYLMIVPVH